MTLIESDRDDAAADAEGRSTAAFSFNVSDEAVEAFKQFQRAFSAFIEKNCTCGSETDCPIHDDVSAAQAGNATDGCVCGERDPLDCPACPAHARHVTRQTLKDNLVGVSPLYKLAGTPPLFGRYGDLAWWSSVEAVKLSAGAGAPPNVEFDPGEAWIYDPTVVLVDVREDEDHDGFFDEHEQRYAYVHTDFPFVDEDHDPLVERDPVYPHGFDIDVVAWPERYARPPVFVWHRDGTGARVPLSADPHDPGATWLEAGRHYYFEACETEAAAKNLREAIGR